VVPQSTSGWRSPGNLRCEAFSGKIKPETQTRSVTSSICLITEQADRCSRVGVKNEAIERYSMSRPLNPWKLSGYKPGQNVVCRISNPEPGGYAVIIPKDGLPGFLPTTAVLRTDEELLAQFVCVHNNRILLSARFSNTSHSASGQNVHNSVDWGQHLDDATLVDVPAYEPAPETADHTYLTTGNASANAILSTNTNGARQLATHIQTPYAGSDAEAAFDVWAHAHPRKFHLKRATDLVLPPLQPESENKFKIADYDLEWLITDLEGGMRTGCVKASSESKVSRSAMLLYKGRAVGCIYGCKSMPETQPTEQSLQHMLADLEAQDTNVRMYDLPDSVTLAMSALFLGYPVQRNDDYDALSYMNYICNWFENKGQTACLAITLPASSATCLAFIHKGHFCGAFYVEDQKFTEQLSFVHELLQNDPQANIEASILPPEMTSSAVRFGFSLSMARQRNRVQTPGQA
jgi:hypothetical protein